MKHLTNADYKTMPWANGKGTTVEMLRVENEAGLLWRLSRASVVENGDFSLFPNIERNLTVISGPGFDLTGAQNLRCAPLEPISFAGDIALTASNVTAPSDDFNVMTARHLPRPSVQVVSHGTQSPPKGGTLYLFALESAQVAGRQIAQYDLMICDAPVQIRGQMIAVGLTR